MIDALKENDLNVAIGNSFSSASNGQFIRELKLILLSPDHLLLDDNLKTNTFLHEVSHADREQAMAKGISSDYDAALKGDLGSYPCDVPAYGAYFSFDELFAHSSDVALLEQGVKNIDVETGGAILKDVIKSKVEAVLTMTQAITPKRCHPNIQSVISSS